VLLPQADGGEGTVDAIEASVGGSVRRPVGPVSGPDGRPTPGEWLELPGSVAVVELAQASGLPLMQRPDALGATTRGTGEVIRRALTAGARSLVLTLGGSASTDGGSGALTALGLGLRDAHGLPIPDGGRGLTRLETIERDGLLTPPVEGVTLLTDVTHPLLGPTGAAHTFGPQKGATPEQCVELDAALAHWAQVVHGNPDAPGAGAAGGTAFGFASLWGATIEHGAQRIAGLTGLDRAAASADLVITGEGRFDEQSLRGKVVGYALRLPTQVGIIAGAIKASTPGWSASLTDLAGSSTAALADPARWLAAAGALAAQELSLP
jgi:glycerate kinase